MNKTKFNIGDEIYYNYELSKVYEIEDGNVTTVISNAGADRIITIDLHADQIVGFFDIPVNNITSKDIVIPLFDWFTNDYDIKLTVCGPDIGAAKKTDKIFNELTKKFNNISFAIFSKMRNKPNSVERVDLIGDVKDSNVLLFDDIIDTGGTLMATVKELYNRGAKKVYAYITHGLLNGDAVDKIKKSYINLSVSDSLPVFDRDNVRNTQNINTYSVANAIAQKIK